jgi:hypothetical protein
MVNAQTSATDKALASQLFDEAQSLKKAGHLADACPKFAESQRLDAQLGTLIHLADCYEKTGKSASAWALFREAAGLAEQRKDKREELARTRRDKLEAVLSKIKLDVPASAPPNLEIRQDDTVVGSAVWTVAMPVDPGTHTIVARADGYKEWSTTISVPAGPNVMRVPIPGLERAAAPELGASPAGATQPVDPEVRRTEPVDSKPNATPAPRLQTGSTSGVRIAGYVMGGLGVAGAAVGAVFLVRRQSMVTERDDATACTRTRTGCTEIEQLQINHLEKVVKNDTLGAYAGFIAGGALLTTGVVMVLVGGSSTPSSARRIDITPWAGPNAQGISLSGRW